jgi:hypothetical protein
MEGAHSMHADLAKRIKPTDSNLVVALFTDRQYVQGAIADLRDVGFSSRQIRIAFSVESKQAEWGESAVRDQGRHAVSEEKNSLAWRLKRSFEHDLHRSGADQMTGEDEDLSSSGPGPPYSQVDLRETLLSMGVVEQRILLLNREMGEKGALVLVNAEDRTQEVESIMVRNSGQMRTDTATEHPPLLDRPAPFK